MANGRFSRGFGHLNGQQKILKAFWTGLEALMVKRRPLDLYMKKQRVLKILNKLKSLQKMLNNGTTFRLFTEAAVKCFLFVFY